MAKNKVEKAIEDDKKVDAPVKKEIVPATVEQLKASNITLVPYSADNLEAFGASFAETLILTAVAEEEAQKQMAAVGEAKQYLSFEMMRAIFDIASQDEKLDPYAIFGEAKDVEKLNKRILLKMGVLKKTISEDDTVEFTWTSEKLAKQYAYTKALKEENEAEYERRFNNRKRLNQRLSDACKSACTLLDAKLKSDDLFYSEDSTTGAMVPTIRNAPKAIGGTEGVIQMNQRKPVAGATMSPTVASLIKIAKDKHNAPKGDRNDKGENREGVAKLGMSDEDFGTVVNTLKRAINAPENTFSQAKYEQIESLVEYLNEAIEKAVIEKDKEAA